MINPNETSAVLLEVDERKVATVIFNRPEVNNAYDGDLIQGLLGALDALERGRACAPSSSTATASISRPAPISNGSTPCAPLGGGKRPCLARHRRSGATAQLARRCRPSRWCKAAASAAVPALVAACDVVIAADNAVFSIAEVRWGLTAAIIVPQLNDAIGVRQLRRYALTGERFDAEEARRIGLVHEVVPLAELAAAGERVVDQVLQNGPDAIAQTKATRDANRLGAIWTRRDSTA